MTTLKDFLTKIPTDSDTVAGFKSPGNTGDDRKFVFIDILNYIIGNLGSAALKDTGVAAGEVPTNADLTATLQPLDAGLTSIATLGLVADRILFTTALETYAETALTGFMRTLLDDINALTARATLGAQEQADVLDDLVGLTQATDRLPYMDSPTTMALTVFTAYARGLLDDVTALEARGTLGLDIDDDVEFEDIKTNARFLGKKGSDVASANDMTLGDGNYFVITGTTQINTISTTGWTAGSIVTLNFVSNPLVKDGTAGGGASLDLAGAADYVTTAADNLMLQLNDTEWEEISRTIK